MLKKVLICTSAYFCAYPLIAVGADLQPVSQISPEITDEKTQQLSKGLFIGVGAGLSSFSFRDFATSPLFYSGLAPTLSLSVEKKRMQRDTDAEIAMSLGNLSSSYNGSDAISKMKRVDVSYSELFHLKQLSKKTLQTKVGFLANVTGNLRQNEILQNNAVGIEIIPTLFGSVKIVKDISRKADKRGKFLFLPYRLKEKQQTLAFRLNIGVVNSSFRNGFAYINQSSIINNQRVFEGYRFSIFSGFRLSTTLDYTRYLKNHNAIRLSYNWDAYVTGGKSENMNMASHNIKISLLFNTSK